MRFGILWSVIIFFAGYARDHEPCIIFMDEIDAIGKGCSTVMFHFFFFFLSEYHSHRYNNFDVLCFLLPGGRRFSEGTSADREIQRTLMEVCRK